MKQTVLCFLLDESHTRLLMIFKKTGQGAGKWNVPGGKIIAGETELAAVVRETIEETGLCPIDPQLAGRLDFIFSEGNNWNNTCAVFRAENFSGTLLPETAECRSEWVPINQIPYEKMWEADKIWAPLVFAEKYFERSYTFDSTDQMISEKIIR